MEEREVIRYFCSGCNKEYKSKNGCKGHEKKCWYMPELKACPTCRFATEHEKAVPVDTLDEAGNKVFITGYMANGYNCLNPAFEEHSGRYAKEYHISVGCELHKPFDREEEI